MIHINIKKININFHYIIIQVRFKLDSWSTTIYFLSILLFKLNSLFIKFLLKVKTILLLVLGLNWPF